MFEIGDYAEQKGSIVRIISVSDSGEYGISYTRYKQRKPGEPILDGGGYSYAWPEKQDDISESRWPLHHISDPFMRLLFEYSKTHREVEVLKIELRRQEELLSKLRLAVCIAEDVKDDGGDD